MARSTSSLRSLSTPHTSRPARRSLVALLALSGAECQHCSSVRRSSPPGERATEENHAGIHGQSGTLGATGALREVDRNPAEERPETDGLRDRRRESGGRAEGKEPPSGTGGARETARAITHRAHAYTPPKALT
ncbi:hypothetical protein GCM10022227_08270 [Streptomyces sedi]